MNNILKLIFGTLVGLTVSFIFGCLIFKFVGKIDPLENLNVLNYGALSGRALSIGAIPNIGLFYLFLNKENYFSARGIILSFFIIGLFILFG